MTAGKLVNPSFKSAGSGRPSKYYSITLEGRRCRGFESQQARFRLRSTFVYSRTKKNDTANASAELGTPACPLVSGDVLLIWGDESLRMKGGSQKYEKTCCKHIYDA